MNNKNIYGKQFLLHQYCTKKDYIYSFITHNFDQKNNHPNDNLKSFS